MSLQTFCIWCVSTTETSHTNPLWLYWLCGWSWSCVLFNRLLKTVLIHLSGKKDICLYCQTERLNSQENDNKKPAVAENMTYKFQIVFEIFLCTTVPCLTTSWFRGKSIGMNVSAVIIYIHSLTYHCDSRMAICTKPVVAFLIEIQVFMQVFIFAHLCHYFFRQQTGFAYQNCEMPL